MGLKFVYLVTLTGNRAVSVLRTVEVYSVPRALNLLTGQSLV